jgi:hypothetical protein
MESWRMVWRDGFAPLLTDDHLAALRDGLARDDPALLQGRITEPPPLACCSDWPVKAACLLGYGGWKAYGLATVGEVEEFFAGLCVRCDEALGEPAGCRWFLAWFDEAPRAEVVAELLAEVRAELARRGVAAGFHLVS